MILKLFSFFFLSGIIYANPLNDGPSYLSPSDPQLPRDYQFQGEYEADKVGVQIIALSNGRFHGVVLPGGLPGAGWDSTNKSLMDGVLVEDEVRLTSCQSPRKYLAEDPLLFSASPKFPPNGHQKYQGIISANGNLILTHEESGKKTLLKKTIRTSPTLGKKAPANALVLFDGEDSANFKGGRLDQHTKWLNTDGKDIISIKKFSDYHIHLEFMLPFRPTIRGQHRGNSGFYQVDLYEMQILDSFGLHSHHFDCGGIYSQVPPLTNACFPPLVWQTYDVDFENAKFENARKIKNARITARLNGILIHQNYEFPRKTGGSRNEPEGTAGPIKLQGHANPLQFRNIWIIEK